MLIYAALNPVSQELERSITRFNNEHTDVQIEIRDYSDEGGIQRLLVELVAGYVPDIMEMHRYGGSSASPPYGVPGTTDRPEGEYWMPYQQLVQKGYLENLWPYIENDLELGRKSVLEAPLKAAEVNGGLYMLFSSVRIITLMGPERVVGDRCGWTFEQLMEAFSMMPEDSTILRYCLTKQDIFSRLISFSLGRYVDWNSGTCSFDNDVFRNMLAFLNSFPDEFPSNVSEEIVREEIIRRLTAGQQMLEGVVIGELLDIAYNDALWRETAAFPGYPTADGSSGSFFDLTGSKLAMSSTCQNKDAVWDFMRQLIIHRYTPNSIRDAGISIPVNLQDYEISIKATLQQQLPSQLPWLPFSDDFILYFPVKTPNKDDLQRFEALIDSTTQIYWPDNNLSDIVWESISPYFAGDRSLDDTVALVQNRASLYVSEQQ